MLLDTSAAFLPILNSYAFNLLWISRLTKDCFNGISISFRISSEIGCKSPGMHVSPRLYGEMKAPSLIMTKRGNLG